VKYTEVGDAEGDICTRDVVAVLGNNAVLAFELFVVTRPKALTQGVWQLKVTKAAVAATEVIVENFVRCRFSDRLRGCSSQIVVIVDSISNLKSYNILLMKLFCLLL